MSEYWLFGYGSLIWKPPPHYDRRIPGFILGYVRRFWQASEDHRGTPEAPGRVVTLLEREYWETLGEEVSTPQPDKVYGAAYRIIPDRVDEVQQYLDIREVGGYSIERTTFYPIPEATTGVTSSVTAEPLHNCIVYIGLPTNPQFLGLQSADAVAEVIARSEGPSGKNAEYLFMLEESLRDLLNPTGHGDEHVSQLASNVRSLLQQTMSKDNSKVAGTN